jgi:hypothetical protein
MEIIFAKSAAKHSISKAEVIKIMVENTGTKVGLSRERLDKVAWIGGDSFNQLIEIIAIDFITYKYVIHVMPISKRGGVRDGQMEGLW